MDLKLKKDGKMCTLQDCPPGLFLFDGTLGFKTEHYMRGAPEGLGAGAYVLASGEVFWGGAHTHKERCSLMVQPLTYRCISINGGHLCNDMSIQSLEIQAAVMGSPDQVLAGVEFLVTDGHGVSGSYTTDQQGRIRLSDLEPDSVITVQLAKEVDGYTLETAPHRIKISPDNDHVISFYADPKA